MKIKAKIQSLAEELLAPVDITNPVEVETPEFQYARKSEANIIFDNGAETIVLFIEPDSFGWRNDSTTGVLQRYTDCHLQFIRKIERGQMAEFREPVIEAMKDLAADFIQLVLNDSDFDLYSLDIPAIPVIDYYDTNYAGVEINLAKLIFKEGDKC